MVPLSSITMIMGDTDLVPFDAGTFGSRTTPQMGTQLRKAAATAREALVEMAAKNWNTPAESLKAENGMIVNTAANKKIGYGELTKGQQLADAYFRQCQNDCAKRLEGGWKIGAQDIMNVILSPVNMYMFRI